MTPQEGAVGEIGNVERDPGHEVADAEVIPEAGERPPQPPAAEVEAELEDNSIDDEESSLEARHKRRGHKRVSEWIESCNQKKCRRCLEKNSNLEN